jgi:putative sigma-54 modulation protein
MLNIDIRGEDMELTEAIENAIQKKLGAIEKYMETVSEPKTLRVSVGKISDHHKKGDIFKAEADLLIPGHKIHAEITAGELYAAIDLLKDELKNRLIKLVDTTTTNHRDGARAAKEQGTETELV